MPTPTSGFFGDGAAAYAVESAVGATVSAEILAVTALNKRGMESSTAMSSLAWRIRLQARAAGALLARAESDRLALCSGVALSALTEAPGGVFRDAETLGLSPSLRDGLHQLVDDVLSSFLDEAKCEELVQGIHGRIQASPPKDAMDADAALAHCLSHAARLSPPAGEAFDRLLRRVRPNASAHERLEVLRSLPRTA